MVIVANETGEFILSTQDLREVTSYAAASAQEVPEIFERAHPADSRPRDVIAAWHPAASPTPTRLCTPQRGPATPPSSADAS
jgi:hypothetical protein